MNCLVIAATPLEIAPLLKDLGKGKFQQHQADVLITGVGLTAATFSLTRQIALKKPEIVIQAGIAGCFDNNIPLATVLAVKQDAIADLGVVESRKLKTIFDLKLAKKNKFPYSGGWLVNKSSALKKTKLKKVRGISVNQVTSSSLVIKLYRKKFNPVLESMEGAALHYVCLMEKIPFIQLRSISNYAGERNKKNWNMKEAINNLNKELTALLEQL